MADPGDKNYHRRNVILDDEIALAAMDWHGGQGSMVYSLASTAHAGKLVSPAMLDAAVAELEANKPLPKGYSKKDRKDLDDLIGELDARARFSDEFTIREATGEDIDDGESTWLMSNPSDFAQRDPVASTALGSGLGALGGAVLGMIGGPVGMLVGSAAGGAAGGYFGAPKDRKQRGAVGGGVGGLIGGPTGSALGGALGGRKTNPHEHTVEDIHGNTWKVVDHSSGPRFFYEKWDGSGWVEVDREDLQGSTEDELMWRLEKSYGGRKTNPEELQARALKAKLMDNPGKPRKRRK